MTVFECPEACIAFGDQGVASLLVMIVVDHGHNAYANASGKASGESLDDSIVVIMTPCVCDIAHRHCSCICTQYT